MYLIAIAVAYLSAYFAVVQQVGDVSSGGYLLNLLAVPGSDPTFPLFKLSRRMVMATVIVLVAVYYGTPPAGGP